MYRAISGVRAAYGKNNTRRRDTNGRSNRRPIGEPLTRRDTAQTLRTRRSWLIGTRGARSGARFRDGELAAWVMVKYQAARSPGRVRTFTAGLAYSTPRWVPGCTASEPDTSLKSSR